MKTTKFETREEWLAGRKGKITGSRIKDVVQKKSGSGHKIGYYELIAERLATEPEGDETPMDRGTRLEPEAMAKFMEVTGKVVDTSLVLWQREDNPNIAISPDGFIFKSEAVEGKCLSSAKHIEAWLTQKIPSDYWYQVLQYFVVNDELEKLHFAFFDPRIPCKDFFVIEVKREDVQAEVDECLEYQRETLKEIAEIVSKLTF